MKDYKQHFDLGNVVFKTKIGQMQYLSKQIEAHAKRKKQAEKSLINNQISCGIFQDYGDIVLIHQKEDAQHKNNFA